PPDMGAGRAVGDLTGRLRLLRRPLRDGVLGLLTMERSRPGPMRGLAALVVPILVAVLALAGSLAGCGAPTGSPVELPDGSAARRWGDGQYGLVLVHEAGRDAASWE